MESQSKKPICNQIYRDERAENNIKKKRKKSSKRIVRGALSIEISLPSARSRAREKKRKKHPHQRRWEIVGNKEEINASRFPFPLSRHSIPIWR